MFNWDAAAKQLSQEEDTVDGERELILIVDDEETNRALLKGILGQDFDVITACDGEEALEKSSYDGVCAIVCDHRMPGMTGVEFFSELEKRGHSATRIILTGYAELQSIISAINQAGIFRYLTKPVETDTLRSTVREAVHQYQIRQENGRLISLVKTLVEEKSELIKEMEVEGIDTSSLADNAPEMAMDEPRKVSLAVMFCDICGLAELTETLSATRLVGTLRTIFSRIHEIIYEHGGIVDKHLGDGLMAVFGLNTAKSPSTVIKAVEAIVKEFPSILESVEGDDFKELKLSLGAASGEVVLGMLGTERRSELAIIGQPANRAARLQELPKLALQDGLGRETFGEFECAMGLVDVNLIEEGESCSLVQLNGLQVRDFGEITELALVKV
ncbi:MAG: response regulator [Deltaproteobacteria bacterium]|jgi:class 3 adenylate cyclase/CheY-like chemotaxis protein|nr:response regulator [Deltaproteobacteria bacterium]